MSEIDVRIEVTGANGRSSSVRVTDFLRPGEIIPERINVLAAEAAALADMSLKLAPDNDTHYAHRDKRKTRR